jgi:hypothetical protein
LAHALDVVPITRREIGTAEPQDERRSIDRLLVSVRFLSAAAMPSGVAHQNKLSVAKADLFEKLE